MKKVGTVRAAATLVAAVCISTTFAQTFSVNLGQNNASAAAATSAGADVVKVVARGVGTNETAALTDAYRDAVERAVGLYVDADAAAKNDKIVKDQVLTQSNGYVTHYEKIESTKISGGLVQVRIVATVKKQDLAAKLQSVMPAQTVHVDSGSLKDSFAQMASKDKQSGDAVALLKAALEDVDPIKSLLVANLRPDTQKILTGDTVKVDGKPLSDDKVLLRYLFELKLDRQKYFNEFVPHLKKTLDQISLTPPKEIRLVELAEQNNRIDSRIEKYKSGKERIREGFGIFDTRFTEGAYDGWHVYSALIGGKNLAWMVGNSFTSEWAPKSGGAFSYSIVRLRYGEFDSDYSKSKVLFCLITKLGADASTGKVTVYELDKKVVDVLGDWIYERVGYGDRKRGSKYGFGEKANYSIVFLDKDGEEIGVYPWEIGCEALINLKVADISDNAGGGRNATAQGMVYCAPFVGCFGESYIEWKDFVLDKTLLPKIASIKIELAD